MFYLGRHVQVFIIISSQYVKSLHPGVRSNVDVVFTFTQRSLLERQALAEQYLDAFPTQDVFTLIDTYAKIDHEQGFHQFVAVETRNLEGKDLRDTIYYGHAESVPPFILGCKEFWGKDIYEYQRNQLEKRRRMHKKPERKSLLLGPKPTLPRNK